MSVFVGRKTDNDVCRILTLAEGVDNPTYVEFPAPTADNPPPVGTPKWANYVKGVITHFKGMVNVFMYVYFRYESSGLIPSGQAPPSGVVLSIWRLTSKLF